MRTLPFVLVIALRVLVVATPVSAQSLDDLVAWVSLVRSPIGGIVSAPAGGGAASEQRRAVSLNMGSWRFAPGDDETTNVGATMQFPAGRVTLLLNGMATTVKGCNDCGGFSIGGGVLYGMKPIPLGASSGARVDVGIQPSANYGSWGDGDVTSTTAALSMPVAVSLPLGSVTLRPFITPGFGYGAASASDESYSGTRSFLGFGLAIASRSGRLQAHVGSVDVKIEEGPSVTGAGLTFRF